MKTSLDSRIRNFKHLRTGGVQALYKCEIWIREVHKKNLGNFRNVLKQTDDEDIIVSDKSGIRIYEKRIAEIG